MIDACERGPSMGPLLESRLESPRIPHTCTCTGARAVPGEERTAPLLLEALVTLRRHRVGEFHLVF